MDDTTRVCGEKRMTTHRIGAHILIFDVGNNDEIYVGRGFMVLAVKRDVLFM